MLNEIEKKKRENFYWIFNWWKFGAAYRMCAIQWRNSLHAYAEALQFLKIQQKISVWIIDFNFRRIEAYALPNIMQMINENTEYWYVLQAM